MVSLQFVAILALGTACFYAFWIAYTRHAYSQKMRRLGCQPIPRYPHKDPLGYDLYKITAEGAIQGDTLSMRRKLYAKYGNTYASNWIGQSVVGTCSMENIQTVLGSSANHFTQVPLRNHIAKPLLNDGLLTRDGPAWQHSRALAISVLGKEQAADLASLEVHFQKFLKLIPRDGSTVDLQPLIKKLFIDKGTELIFGESINSLSPTESHPEVENFLDLFEKSLRVMGLRLRLGNLRFLRGPDSEWRSNCRKIYKTLDGFIDEAIERRVNEAIDYKKGTQAQDSSQARYVMIDKYLDVIEDRDEIKTELVNTLLGARDQIGIAMSLVMFTVARHPTVWAKLQKESLANTGPLTIETIKAHVFARGVVCEALRVNPSVARSIRNCAIDCILPRGGGNDGQAPILIQRGTQVEMDFGPVQREKAIWGEDADEFRPERWDNGRPGGWAWMPFLNGRRACPAMNMCLTQMTYVLVRLSQEYKAVENRDSVLELVDDMRNVRQSRNGVKVAMIPA